MLLKKLTETSGVSGNEKEVRDLIISEIKDYVDEIKIDRIGNIIAYKKASNNKNSNKKIMLAAHMDEVGLLIRDIDESGLLKFTTVGGIDKRILVSKPVLVGDGKIAGVIGAKPIHLQAASERKTPLDIESLYIDIGAKSKDDALKYVEIGDYVSFDSSYIEFGDKKVKAKALDDRVGCAIIIDLLKNDRLSNVDFYGVFTVMEEIGLRGAGPAANQIEPDYALILEGTLCYELPKLENHLIPTKLGHGPAISLIDRTTIYFKDVRDYIVDIAKKENIPYQFRTTAMGGNDSGQIHTNKEGCKTITVSVPCRNIHSTTSVMDLNDYNNTLKLSREILLKLDNDLIKEEL